MFWWNFGRILDMFTGIRYTVSYPSWKPTKAWMRWVLYHLGIQIFDFIVCSFEKKHKSLRPAGRVASQFGCFLWVVVSRVFIPRWYCTWDLPSKNHLKTTTTLESPTLLNTIPYLDAHTWNHNRKARSQHIKHDIKRTPCLFKKNIPSHLNTDINPGNIPDCFIQKLLCRSASDLPSP